MQPMLWILAVAALAACLVATLWLLLRNRRKRIRGFMTQNSSAPSATEDDRDSPSAFRARMLARLEAKYDSIARFLRIPEDAAVVPVNTVVFGLEKREFLHYIWATQPNLYLFPVWEDVARYFNPDDDSFPYREGDENEISTIAIPKNRIDFWRVLQSGGVEIFYTNSDKNERVDLILRSVPPEPFRAILPEKEEAYIITQIYPKSSKNIFDIKDEFNDLKARWERGELSNEEFDLKKKIILLTM